MWSRMTIQGAVEANTHHEIPWIVQSEVDTWEAESRRMFLRHLNGGIRWLQSKMSPYEMDVQQTSFGDIFRIVLTITYRALPMPPKIIRVAKPGEIVRGEAEASEAE